MPGRLVYINNDFVAEAEAALLVSDLAMQRGYAVFDYFKTINHIPVYLDEHLDRFYASAAYLRLPVQDRASLKAVICDLIRRNEMADSGLRITLTGGYSADGYAQETPNLVITQKTLQTVTPADFEKGIRLVTYNHQRQMPGIKTIDYLMAIWLQPFIRQHNAEDVLYYNNGIITECPRANFFIVTSANRVVTPSAHILPGIIRMKVLRLAATQYETAERDITLYETEHAAEAFITSTTRHVLPVLQVNGKAVGNGRPGPVTRWLNDALQQAVHDNINLRPAGLLTS